MDFWSEIADSGLYTRAGIWAFLGIVSYLVGRQVLMPVLAKLSKRSSTELDDLLVANGVTRTLANLFTAVVLNATLPLLDGMPTPWPAYTVAALNVYLILTSYVLVLRVMRVAYLAYERKSKTRNMPVKTITQAIAVVLTIIAVILVIGQITGKSPIYLLSGLGALTAVLMLVFKDSILGLVAGVQLSVNDLVRKGDWIEMPKHGADGDVIDITLTTVRVQNWDKTITSIPAYEMVASAFKNWRGMSESGGRRIKRSINIDLNTIRFLNEDDLAHLHTIKLLRGYLQEKKSEITEFNNGRYEPSDLVSPVNGRRLTNVGTFRAYCVAYLQSHPQIHASTPGLTFIVRQLQPTSEGLPLEIYVFTKDVRWVYYEGIQADIFDHLLAALPEFGLRAYQQPSGNDVLSVGKVLAQRETDLSTGPVSRN